MGTNYALKYNLIDPHPGTTGRLDKFVWMIKTHYGEGWFSNPQNSFTDAMEDHDFIMDATKHKINVNSIFFDILRFREGCKDNGMRAYYHNTHIHQTLIKSREDIKKQLQAGWTLEEIADRFDTTQGTISKFVKLDPELNRINEHRMAANRVPQAMKENIYAEYQKGKTVYRIAKDCGLSYSVAERIIKKKFRGHYASNLQ